MADENTRNQVNKQEKFEILVKETLGDLIEVIGSFHQESLEDQNFKEEWEVAAAKGELLLKELSEKLGSPGLTVENTNEIINQLKEKLSIESRSDRASIFSKILERFENGTESIRENLELPPRGYKFTVSDIPNPPLEKRIQGYLQGLPMGYNPRSEPGEPIVPSPIIQQPPLEVDRSNPLPPLEVDRSSPIIVETREKQKIPESVQVPNMQTKTAAIPQKIFTPAVEFIPRAEINVGWDKEKAEAINALDKRLGDISKLDSSKKTVISAEKAQAKKESAGISLFSGIRRWFDNLKFPSFSLSSIFSRFSSKSSAEKIAPTSTSKTMDSASSSASNADGNLQAKLAATFAALNAVEKQKKGAEELVKLANNTPGETIVPHLTITNDRAGSVAHVANMSTAKTPPKPDKNAESPSPPKVN